MDRPSPKVRPAQPEELAEIISVAVAALHWRPDEPNAEFFRWKHLDNPAGASPTWVATDGGKIVGFRTMLRWRFNAANRTVVAVRAVDTATLPAHQRRGIFRSLTMAAVEALVHEQCSFVFNTPNADSRRGYLSMGWEDRGRLPTTISLRTPLHLGRVVRARTAADKWSLPVGEGVAVDTVADDLLDLLRAAPSQPGITTDRSADHLRWRYGFEPLHYRVIRTDEAAAIVRVRKRGLATEAVLAEVFSPEASATRTLLRRIRQLPGVDHILALRDAPHPTPRLLPLPAVGPQFITRALADSAPMARDFRFSLGDIELF